MISTEKLEMQIEAFEIGLKAIEFEIEALKEQREKWVATSDYLGERHSIAIAIAAKIKAHIAELETRVRDANL